MIFPGLQRVYLFSKIWQGSEYASGFNYKRVLIIAELCHVAVTAYVRITQVLTMVGFWLSLGKVLQGFEYASGSKYCRAWEKRKDVNMQSLHRVLNMLE